METSWYCHGGLGCQPAGQRYLSTVCPGSSDPFYVVTYYVEWITTSKKVIGSILF